MRGGEWLALSFRLAQLVVCRGIDQTTILTQKLADIGIDLIDVSSGGNDTRQKIDVQPSYRTCYFTSKFTTRVSLIPGQRSHSPSTSRSASRISSSVRSGSSPTRSKPMTSSRMTKPTSSSSLGRCFEISISPCALLKSSVARWLLLSNTRGESSLALD